MTIVLVAVLVEGGLALLAVFLGRLFGQAMLLDLSWDPGGWLWGAAAAVPMAALFAAMNRWPVGPLARIRRFGEEVVRPLLAGCTVIDLLGISVLAGVGEEMLFRDFLQGACQRWFGAVAPAVAVASLAFGLLHAVTPTYAVLAALLGAYLGVVWWLSGNLMVAIVAHALYDFAALLWLMRGPGSGKPEEPAEKTPDP
jgi:membrane protease YdiL (CAAX protease family)